MDEQFRLCIESQNEQAKKYRAVFTHLIRVVCVFGNLAWRHSVDRKKSILPPTEEIPGGAEVAGK